MEKLYKNSSEDRPHGLIKKLWYFLKNNQWLIIGILGFVTFLLGYLGIKTILNERREMLSVTDHCYGALQLFAMDNSLVGKKPELPLTFEIARFLAPVVVGWTAAMALFSVFHERLRIFKLRCFVRNHVIICGLGRKGLLLAEKFCNANRDINCSEKRSVVVIEKNKDNSLIEKCKDMGATVLIGNATDQELLSDAGVHKAEHLISICGDDGINAEVAIKTLELIKKGSRKNVLLCSIHVIDPDLWHLLREREIGAENINDFRLQFFNVFDSGVRILLDEYPVFTACDNPGYNPHFLIVGLGRMGASLVAHLARKRWNAVHKNPNVTEKIRITIIDRNGETNRRLLCLKYPRLQEVCDLTVRQMDVHSPEFQQCEFLYEHSETCDVSMVFVCFDDDSAGLTVALDLHHHLRDFMVPIVVRTTYDTGLATLLAGADKHTGGFENLYAFGLMDRACTLKVLKNGTHEILARAIHDDYLQGQGDSGQNTQTNPSMVTWDALSDDMKDSNRRQADHIDDKLEAVGCRIAQMTDWGEKLFEFTEAEVEILAKMEHNRWCKERWEKGWKYSETKDNEKKLNPNLVSWEKLSEGIKKFNRKTIQRMPFILSKVGFRIFRSTREILARAIHDDYMLSQKNQGNTMESNPSMVPWYELRDEFRESNRKHADFINVRLMIIGYRLVRVKDRDVEAKEFNFTPEEIEIMAKMEHNRWVEERKSTGWEWGQVKDVNNKMNPYLISWGELPEDQKDYNRMNSKKLPEFLARAGFRIIHLKKKGQSGTRGISW